MRRLAVRLGRGKAVAVDDDQTIAVDMPPQIDVGVELEREDGNASLELEFERNEQQGSIDIAATASKADYEVYQDSAGEYR